MTTPSKEFWQVFRSTNGALSCCEAIFIMQAAALAPKGRYIECGTAYGKSALAAIVSLREYENNDDCHVQFIMVDPLFKDLKIAEEIISKVRAISDKIMGFNFEAAYSTEIIPYYENYSYAMLDSGDHDTTIVDEFNLVKDRIVSGGVVVLHDLDSQYIRVREVYNMFLQTGNYEEIKPDWEAIEAYAEEHNLEDGTNQTWHHTELKHPKFIGALRKK